MAIKTKKNRKLSLPKTKRAAAKKGGVKISAGRDGASNKGKAMPSSKATPRKTKSKKKVAAVVSSRKRKKATARPMSASHTNVAAAAGAKKKAKAAVAKSGFAKVAAKASAKNPADRIAALEKDITKVRSELKNALKTEISAAFDVCLSAMEQAANLMESRLVTVLGEMSNLVTGAKPDFKDGKLKSVFSDDGNERTDFSYGNDGLVTSRTYRSGKLKFEIVHGKLGNPISGKMFDPSGKVVKEFSYGPDGQVK